MNEARDLTWASSGEDGAVVEYLASLIARTAPCRLAVPGGGTPVPILEALAQRDLPWEEVAVSLTDDRQVPADHPASNQHMLERILGPTGARIERLHPSPAPQRFDCVWLGMGADGHIASLFPEMEAEEVDGPAVIPTVPDPLPENAPFARQTLNMAALTNADAIILVVRGEAKKQVLDAAIAGGNDLPIAGLLRAATCPVTIFWEA